MKSFGQLNCNLCMKERTTILKVAKEEKLLGRSILINSKSEIYGACRHKTKFHRYHVNEVTSADEGNNPERVKGNAKKSQLSLGTPNPGSLGTPGFFMPAGARVDF